MDDLLLEYRQVYWVQWGGFIFQLYCGIRWKALEILEDCHPVVGVFFFFELGILSFMIAIRKFLCYDNCIRSEVKAVGMYV